VNVDKTDKRRVSLSKGKRKKQGGDPFRQGKPPVDQGVKNEGRALPGVSKNAESPVVGVTDETGGGLFGGEGPASNPFANGSASRGVGGTISG